MPSSLRHGPVIQRPSSSPGKAQETRVQAPVALFWDFENVKIPSELTTVYAIARLRKTVRKLGKLKRFRAYMETSLERSTKASSTRSELQSSGCSIIDTPHCGSKEVADKMIIVDMMVFALEQPAPATIVLISGDKDFAYVLSTLNNWGYTIVLICPSNTNDALRSQSEDVRDWRADVLQLAPRTADEIAHKKEKKIKRKLKKRDAEAVGLEDAQRQQKKNRFTVVAEQHGTLQHSKPSPLHLQRSNAIVERQPRSSARGAPKIEIEVIELSSDDIDPVTLAAVNASKKRAAVKPAVSATKSAKQNPGRAVLGQIDDLSDGEPEDEEEPDAIAARSDVTQRPRQERNVGKGEADLLDDSSDEEASDNPSVDDLRET